MSLPTLATRESQELGAALIAHLDAQLASADRMLDLVLQQGRAVRARDVESVLSLVGQLERESDARGALEASRTALLQRAGASLGVPGSAITIDAFCTLLTPPAAAAARERSTRLRGVLREVRDEHLIVRTLMRQELAFVDHLVRLLGGEDSGDTGAYQSQAVRKPAHTSAPQTHRLLDLQA